MDARMPPTERWPFNWVCNTRHNKPVCDMQRISEDVGPHFGVCSELKMLLGTADTCSSKYQYSAARVQLTAQQLLDSRQPSDLCGYGPQQPLGSSQVNSLYQPDPSVLPTLSRQTLAMQKSSARLALQPVLTRP